MGIEGNSRSKAAISIKKRHDDVGIEDTDTWSKDHDGGNNLHDTFQFVIETNVIEEVSEDEYTDGDSDKEDVYLANLE